MYKYILRRILIMIPMLVLISIIVFTFSKLAPGDPFTGEFDPRITKDILDKKRAMFNLYDPPYKQYLSWLKNVLQGNFGVSMRFGFPVSDLLAERIPNTLFLAITSLIITLIVSIPIGIISARRPYSLIDYSATTFGFLGLATPNFYAGLIAIYLFSIQFGWLPAQGTITAGADYTGLALFWDKFKHVIMPASTLGLAQTAGYMRYMRSEMMEVMGKDFIRTARSKGMPERVILYKHTLRNALIPIITLLGFEFGALVAGAVITENVFSWPGVGTLFLNAVINRDYPIIMAINLIIATMVLVGNLLADIFYVIVDPRIRYD
ncbi:peptide permease [Vulcanibacillus modesticaldus]|uniref:Peptide permease n=1 Tax=Vulcanibacillus modesticaldus TaxID=337097 RepID=A0A1D2YVP9_9BACI|nr:ABC transporter permease [Vulcanibacillus modesticaldus]OEF99743.1 peptide permease [Vulcanibacillus modesticaldus]